MQQNKEKEKNSNKERYRERQEIETKIVHARLNISAHKLKRKVNSTAFHARNEKEKKGLKKREKETQPPFVQQVREKEG